jgi:ribosomal protein S18 acetylase RimI-like enzyme
MAMDIIVREMTEADLPQVLALYDQPDMDNGEVIDYQSALMLMKKIAEYPFYRFYVAVQQTQAIDDLDQQDIVGVFGLLVMDNFGHQGAASGVVEGVCVSPKHQGQGIGKRMMDKAMDVSREQGCYKVALSSNMVRTRAHAFYENLGFKQHGLSFYIDLVRGC